MSDLHIDFAFLPQPLIVNIICPRVSDTAYTVREWLQIRDILYIWTFTIGILSEGQAGESCSLSHYF